MNKNYENHPLISKVIVCLGLVIISISCNFSNKDEKQKLNNINTVKDNDQTRRVSDNAEYNYNEDDYDSLFNSSKYSYELGKNSVFGSVLEGVKIDSTVIDITTEAEDQSVTNSPLNLGDEYSLDKIAKEFSKYQIDTLKLDTVTVFKLTYKNSIVSLIEDGKKFYGLIPYAIILDEEIPLNFGLKIGMSETEVIKRLFKETNINDLKRLDKIVVGSLVGNFYTYYNFKDHKLTSVESGFEDYYLIEELGLDKTEFKYGHLKKINFPNDIGNIGLKILDSNLTKKYLKDYNPAGEVYLYSDQNDIGDLKIFTVFNAYELCQTEINLIITDKVKNIITIKKVAEGGGCDLPSESYSEFINDSVFRRIEYPDLSHEFIDSLDQIGEKYHRITNLFEIQLDGKIKTLSHKVDTLTIK